MDSLQANYRNYDIAPPAEKSFEGDFFWESGGFCRYRLSWCDIFLSDNNERATLILVRKGPFIYYVITFCLFLDPLRPPLP